MLAAEDTVCESRGDQKHLIYKDKDMTICDTFSAKTSLVSKAARKFL